MKRILPHPITGSPDNLMKHVGYVRHCTEAGRACFHRQLNDPPFPRFHAYVSVKDEGMEIDLHFDAQDPLKHKGNHDKEWAYSGGRVNGEMNRIFNIFNGEIKKQKTNQSTVRVVHSDQNAPKKKSLFDVLFK